MNQEFQAIIRKDKSDGRKANIAFWTLLIGSLALFIMAFIDAPHKPLFLAAYIACFVSAQAIGFLNAKRQREVIRRLRAINENEGEQQEET